MTGFTVEVSTCSSVEKLHPNEPPKKPIRLLLSRIRRILSHPWPAETLGIRPTLRLFKEAGLGLEEEAATEKWEAACTFRRFLPRDRILHYWPSSTEP